MSGTEPLAQRRLEYGWPLAGLAWGLVLGIGTTTVPMLLVMLSGGGAPQPETWVVPLLWLALLGITGAVDGALVGLVVGVVVMLVVGRDPEVRAARRTPATLVLLIAPLAALALWYL